MHRRAKSANDRDLRDANAFGIVILDKLEGPVQFYTCPLKPYTNEKLSASFRLGSFDNT